MSEKIEYVEVTLKLPKPLVGFIQKFTQLAGEDPKEYMEWAITHEVRTMLDSEEIFDTPWTDTQKVIKANNLEKVLDC